MRRARLEEIEELYRRDLDRFLRVAAAIVGDRERARDAVQDAFVAAVRSRNSFAGRSSLDAWIWQVVVNSARNYRRASAARQSHTLKRRRRRSCDERRHRQLAQPARCRCRAT